MIIGENMTLGTLREVPLRVPHIYSLNSTTTGVTVLKRGYYRCAITLHLQCVANNVTVAARIAKNNVIDGPVGLSNRTAFSVEASSLSLSRIFFCVPFDKISMYTSRAGAGNETSAKTREGLSSIIIEYIGDDSEINLNCNTNKQL